MWVPYEKIKMHPPDFLIKYRFFTHEEGGRRTLPYQGYRSDFAIEDDFLKNPIDLRVIHPEFEDEFGNLIMDETKQVPINGTARMWVLFPESRARHRKTLDVGMTGYFMEGPKKVAKAEIIKIMGLLTNPFIEK
ncbi:MAG: hypothetical protein ACQEXX_18425 [Bacillota bacterium]